jgi:hypothetical protein
MKRYVFVLAMVCLLAIVPGAMAGSAIIGQSTSIGSWEQEFYENGLYYAPPDYSVLTAYSFDRWQVEMVDGSLDMPPPGGDLPGLSAAGWDYCGTTAWAVITSPTPVSDLYFQLAFQGNDGPVSFDSQIFLGDVLEGTQFTAYNEPQYGSGWQYFNPHDTDVLTFGDAPIFVPEPVSMIFFGTGVVGMLGYVSRRKLWHKA